jgi:hypothetical protein
LRAVERRRDLVMLSRISIQLDATQRVTYSLSLYTKLGQSVIAVISQEVGCIIPAGQSRQRLNEGPNADR